MINSCFIASLYVAGIFSGISFETWHFGARVDEEGNVDPGGQFLFDDFLLQISLPEARRCSIIAEMDKIDERRIVRYAYKLPLIKSLPINCVIID